MINIFKMINNIKYLAVTIIFLNVLLFLSNNVINGIPLANENVNNIRNKRYFDAEAANKQYWDEWDRNQTSTTKKPSGPEIVKLTTEYWDPDSI
uniref:Uncharacterized protein n=1 Tax=Strongyloides venezuelensis TaxID=75913 RepID=A0A0K0FPD2_STRVS